MSTNKKPKAKLPQKMTSTQQKFGGYNNDGNQSDYMQEELKDSHGRKNKVRPP